MLSSCHVENLTSRREWLRASSCGFGMVALSALMNEQAAAGTRSDDPLAPRSAHYPVRAKRVIFVFLTGGPSQVDLFQYKPELITRHGQVPPSSIAHNNEFTTEGFESTKLLKPIAKFRQAGESGIWISELLPHLSRQIDRLCLLNGMEADNPAHVPSQNQMFSGSPFLIRPTIGAWVSYGLGTENQNFPSFVALGSGRRGKGRIPSHFYRNAFLPAIYQGTVLEGDKEFTIRHLNGQLKSHEQSKQMELLQSLNRRYLDQAVADPGIEGLIQSYELAFRMQAQAAEVVDISNETEETKKLYGIGEDKSDSVGRQLLVARRLAESGVRFVQVSTADWDHHSSIGAALPKQCARHDKPLAGLIEDLYRRGLLDETLVVCTGEFGRTPFDQDTSRGTKSPETYGRGHNPQGFSAFLAGGGVKGGLAYGQTDELGYRAVEGKVHIHDLHATMLHLLGLDHERLTYRYTGRDFRLTDVHGRVVREIIA